MTSVSLSVVIVAHDSLPELRLALPALLAELDPVDELIVVDNASSDGLPTQLMSIAPGARLVSSPANVGFAAGANLGAAAANGDLLVLLNPDAVVAPGWAAAMRGPWGGPWAAWMALVLLRDGMAINTSGGILHFTGFGWAGQMGEPVAAAPTEPTDVGFVSGACLALPLATWREVGGFSEHFFMYCEDVDLSLKLRLRGGRLAVVPDARVLHRYEFLKDVRKWRLLERNRWAVVIRTYPAPLFWLVLPALLAAELGVWAVAFRQGWAQMKALATLDAVTALPQLARERRVVQGTRSVPVRTFAAAMSSELDSPYLGRVGRNLLVRGALSVYWRSVCATLRLSGP